MEAFLGMDIYLIDQILKGRYLPGELILDAGAGGGRNLNWFFDQGGFGVGPLYSQSAGGVEFKTSETPLFLIHEHKLLYTIG